MSFEKFAHVRFCFRKASSPCVRGTKWHRARRGEGEGSSDRYVSQSKGTWCKVPAGGFFFCRTLHRCSSKDVSRSSRPELGDASKLRSLLSPSFSNASFPPRNQSPTRITDSSREHDRFCRLAFYTLARVCSNCWLETRTSKSTSVKPRNREGSAMNSRITDGEFRNFAFQRKRVYKSAGKVGRSFRFGSSVRLRA